MSDRVMADKNKLSLWGKLTPILVLLSIGLAFFVGVLWQKVQNLEKGGKTDTANTAQVGNVPEDENGKLSEDQAKKVVKATKEDHIVGSVDADIVMIEYSDFECSFCARFHLSAKQALDEYKDKIALVYRHFPLEVIHTRALPGALASECIAELGGNDAFWKFVDLVFEDQQTTLTETGLKNTAKKSGVSESAFNSCYFSKRHEEKVKNNTSEGSTAGVTGTPAVFIMNKKGDVWSVPGAVPCELLKSTIEEALK